MLEHFLKCSELDWSKMLPKMEHFAPFVLEHFNNSGAYIGAFRGGCKSERGEMLHLFGANAPVAVVNAPFAGEIAPASGGNTPAVGANTPKTGANPPGAGALIELTNPLRVKSRAMERPKPTNVCTHDRNKFKTTKNGFARPLLRALRLP